MAPGKARDIRRFLGKISKHHHNRSGSAMHKVVEVFISFKNLMQPTLHTSGSLLHSSDKELHA